MTVEAKWYGARATDAVSRGAAQGLGRWAEHVLEQATRVVPHLEGMLQDSGATAVDEGDLVAIVTYDTPYAVKQHEEMDYRHAPGRQAKFLETPLNASRDKGLQMVRDEIKRTLGG